METFEVVYSSWYLSDRWNGKEENGCSLHKNLADFDLFVKNYHDSFTNERVVCIYLIPRKPQKALVTKKLYERIINTKFGLNVSYDEEQQLVKDKLLLIFSE